MSRVIQRFMRAPYPVAVAGDGPYVIDASGRRYLDAASGAGVSCLGYSDAEVADAIADQARRFAYVYNACFSTEPAEQLAEALIEATPAGLDYVFFGSGGSESMDGALKMALQYHVDAGAPSRTRFIARRQSYHGCTVGALSVSGNRLRRMVFEPFLAETHHVSPCYAYREKESGESDAAYAARLGAELERTILELGPETVAAFVAEPVVGSTNGCVPPVPGYFRAVREVCTRHGVLFIADEILTGAGRTGTYLAIEQDGVVPDLVVVAKGLAAGYQPLSAIMVSAQVFDMMADRRGFFMHGHTYNGHATACAAGLAVLTALRERQLLGQVATRGTQLREALERRFADHPNVGDIRGRGLLLGIELVADRASKAPLPADRLTWFNVQQAAFERGLVCYPSGGTVDGVAGDHIMLAPPFIIDEGHIAEMVETLAIALDDALTRPAPRFG